MADPADARRPRRWRRGLAEAAIIILAAVLLASLVRAFVFQTFSIPSSSMVPTLGVHDRILVQKAFFTWHDVREGDIFYVLGDNRAISCDSRYWGPVKGSSIIGKVVLLWWHNGHPDLHWF
jgi:hypothetical protein